MVAHAGQPSTPEAETRGSRVQSQSRLYFKLTASVGYWGRSVMMTIIIPANGIMTLDCTYNKPSGRCLLCSECRVIASIVSTLSVLAQPSGSNFTVAMWGSLGTGKEESKAWVIQPLLGAQSGLCLEGCGRNLPIREVRQWFPLALIT